MACRQVQRLHHRWQFLWVLQCTQYLRHLLSLQAGGFTNALDCATAVSDWPINATKASAVTKRMTFIFAPYPPGPVPVPTCSANRRWVSRNEMGPL